MHKSRFPMLAMISMAMLMLAGCSRVAEDWRAAQAADTSEAYQDFMQQHPGSEHTVEAQVRIKQLAENRDWQQAAALDTRDAYEQFVAQHADGKWAQEARVRIENFQLTDKPEPATPADVAAPPVVAATSAAAVGEPPPAPAKPAPAPSRPAVAKPVAAKPTAATKSAAYYAQLGAFGNRASAESEWKRLVGRFPSQLKSLQPRYNAGKSQSKTVYRLQVGVNSEQRARDLCAQLKKQSQACVPVAG